AAKKFGSSAATAFAVAAHRHPRRAAVVDARGTLTYADLDRRTNDLTRALRGHGIGADDVMGILCRNHRGFVEALVTAGKLGTDAVLLNTGFSGPQLGEVARREGVTVLVADDALTGEVAASGLAEELPTYRTWTEPDGGWDAPTFDDLAVSGDGSPVDAPATQSAVVILSSGTTGTPKGTARSIDREKARAGLATNVAVLERLPVRSGDVPPIAALPHVGPHQPPARRDHGLTDGAARAVRPARRRRDLRPRAGAGLRGGPGHAPAHPRAARRRAAPLPGAPAPAHRALRIGAARGARHSLDGRVRRQPPQPRRLYRGGGGGHCRTRRPAGRPRHRRPAGPRRRAEAPRPRRRRGRAGRDGAHLRPQRDALRRLHGRGHQGDRRRLHEHGRPRPPRRRRAPLRRRPRGRHDRLGRRERVPPGGGGGHPRPRVGGRRRRVRRARRGVRPAPRRGRRPRRGCGAHRGGAEG